MTILDKLVEHAFERVKTAKKSVSLDEIKSCAFALPKGDFEFEKYSASLIFPLSASAKRLLPQRVLLQRIFPILKLQRTTKTLVRTAFPC